MMITSLLPRRSLRSRARVGAVGALCAVAAFGLSACASNDVVLGKLFASDAISADLRLGHFDHQNQYLLVCPGTKLTDVQSLTGLTPDRYPLNGFEDKSAIILIGEDRSTDTRTYDLDKLDVCRKNPTPTLHNIDDVLHMKKVDNTWIVDSVDGTATAEANTALDAHSGGAMDADGQTGDATNTDGTTVATLDPSAPIANTILGPGEGNNGMHSSNQ